MKKDKIINLFLIIFLIASIVFGYKYYSLKDSFEHLQSDNLYTSLFISTQLLVNIGENLSSENIDIDYLNDRASIYMSLAPLHKSIDEYPNISEKLFVLITSIKNNTISENQVKQISYDLKDNAKEILRILGLPSETNGYSDMFNKINVLYKDLVLIID